MQSAYLLPTSRCRCTSPGSAMPLLSRTPSPRPETRRPRPCLL